MIKVLYGNEPYIIEQTVKKAKEGLDEFSLFTFDEWGQQVWDSVNQLPMFSERQLVVVYPQKLDNEEFLEYVKHPQEKTDLIVIPEEVDKRTSAFKTLQKSGICQECSKIDKKQLQIFILQLLRKEDCAIREDEYNYFVERCGYLTDDTVNLYAVKNYIKQLSLAESVITKESIDSFVEQSDTTKTFALTKCLLQQDTKRLFLMAQHFMDEKENVIGMLSLLLRSFRLAYKASLYSDRSDAEVGKLLGVPVYQFKDALNYSPKQISDSIDLIQNGVSCVKRGSADSNVVFTTTLAKVMNCLQEHSQELN